MQFSQNNFLTALRGLVTGGGLLRASDTNTASAAVSSDAGFWRDVPFSLASLDLNIALTVNTADAGSAADPVLLGGAFITDDETNARVVKVEETVDTIFRLSLAVPRDYDEQTDHMVVRVLASQLAQSTDDDVELDYEVYVKTAGSALGADVAGSAPGTVLSTTEQWIEFDLSGLDLDRDDVVQFKLITNGANDTNGEEVLIHAVNLSYRSTLVSYDEENAAGDCLR